MLRLQSLFFFITSITRVLLGWSKLTYCPFSVMRPKLDVLVVIGHSVVYESLLLVVVLVVFSSGWVVSLLSRCAVCEVWQLASTRVPVHVLFESLWVVVCVSVVRLSVCVWLPDWLCAIRKPANNGIAAIAVSFFMVPPVGTGEQPKFRCWRRTDDGFVRRIRT